MYSRHDAGIPLTLALQTQESVPMKTRLCKWQEASVHDEIEKIANEQDQDANNDLPIFHEHREQIASISSKIDRLIFSRAAMSSLADSLIACNILTTRRTHLHLASERIQVPRLQIHRARSLKLTSQTFTRTDSRNDTTRRNALNRVLAVPSN